MKLPGWVVDNRTSVLREAEPYRNMTPEQRLRLAKLACEDAVKQLRAQPNVEEILRFRDPLPKSSEEALKRLREEAKARKRQP